MNFPDFSIENHGSILMFRMNSPAAVGWVNENVQQEAQFFWDALVVEPRYAPDLVAGMRADGMVLARMMERNPAQKVREALYERLANFDFTEKQLKDKSLFQLVTLQMLLVGHRNYIGTYTCTCRTLEELFGDQFWHREEKPENIVREDHEPKPLVN